MKPRKPKPNEPSIREKLSAKFDADLLADYLAHGPEAIAEARQKSPEKWLDTVNRRVGTTEPRRDGFASAQNMQDIGRKLLQSIGFTEPDDISIQRAIQANNAFMARLEAIYHAASPIAQEDLN